MTEDERHEYEVLKLATEGGTFAIEIAVRMNPLEKQFALERLQRRRWITLIDISPVNQHPGRLFRVFLASPEAMTWFRRVN